MQFEEKMTGLANSLPRPFPPERILVLGAGHFGYAASERLSRRYAETQFLVIDSREEKLLRIEKEIELPVLAGEAMDFINSNPVADDTWIVPAVPIHVAFLWLLNKLKQGRDADPIDVPESTDDKVPNPFRLNRKTLYTSYATFVCPDVCSEPDEVCTFTGKPRQGNLFEDLRRVELPGFATVVVRSWQLAPGVGGYPGSSLASAFHQVSRKPGRYLVATSCRCHGVIDACRWRYP